MSGDCEICKPNYYFNSFVKACQEVTGDDIVENCLYYNFTSTCIECNPGFYLGQTDSLCHEFKNGIEGCIQTKESNPSLCEKCIRGKLLSTTGTACLDTPQEVCSTYKNIQCLECKPGFILNLNNYLITSSQFATSVPGKEMLNNMMQSLVSGNTSFIDHKVCSSPTVSHCSVLSSYDKCEVCLEGSSN